MTSELQPITATVEQFCKLSGLGKTSVFALVKSGQLRSVLVLNRRLIILESYREMLVAANRLSLVVSHSLEPVYGEPIRTRANN